ncbi:AMP-binding protein, partial [Paenibacillus silvestris]|uniref:AMP-binding protein n=1 Tax=Paenibacillus silvestris TaxID=2606219 RepID=UPI00137289B7
MLTEAEQREAALALSAMDVPYADNMMLDELVSEQAKRTPEQIAVIHGEEQMSYAELEDWSNRWSHHLAERGVQPGDRVGLSVQRGMLSVIGMLAILKAGAAYVPLDPEDPKERKQDVMRRAELVAVVTDAEADFADEAVAVVRLDHSATALRCANSRPKVQRSSRDLAYIIFTSGSTGVPKGVMIEHHAA